MNRASVDCIIVAAGSGKRLGAKIPKAFVRLGGQPLFVHSLLTFAAHKAVGRLIVVAPPAMVPRTRRIVNRFCLRKEVTVVPGGEHRWQSVKNGVGASEATWVMIHDSARPFVAPAVIDAVLHAARRFDAVIAAIPEVDTVRKFSGDRAGETLDRSVIVRVQTPQLFLRAKLLLAFDAATRLSSPPTDEALLMEALGAAVGIAQGDALNFKITTQGDLELAEALWEKRNPVRKQPRHAGSAARRATRV
jgi:2-C-methyl-D-erythritol 4-phosphate cytidylyltransferase